MRPDINLIFLLFPIAFFFQSCADRNKNPSRKKQQLEYNITTDIPLNGRGEKVLGYRFLRQMENKLDLYDISKGYDSIQLRIWYSYAFHDIGQVIILTYEGDEWTADLCTYKFAKKINGRFDTLSTFKKGLPKSGWNFFIPRLYELEVLTLPDLDKISGTMVISDGDVFTVEFGTKSKYRMYQYVDPSDFQDTWREAKQMERILQIIEWEFNFKRVRMPQDPR